MYKRVYNMRFQVKIGQEDKSPMRGQKKCVMRTLVKRAKTAVVAFSILGITVPLISCADLREEFDPSKWHYRPVPDGPPSWEEDFGRPPDTIDGETPFQ
jgi:hypothetical protein